MEIKELKMLEEQAELLFKCMRECHDTSKLIALSHALNETVQVITLLSHEMRTVSGATSRSWTSQNK